MQFEASSAFLSSPFPAACGTVASIGLCCIVGGETIALSIPAVPSASARSIRTGPPLRLPILTAHAQARASACTRARARTRTHTRAR
eukprot:15482531-Alexandrium_andersonii.AAC.1